MMVTAQDVLHHGISELDFDAMPLDDDSPRGGHGLNTKSSKFIDTNQK